jgi:hypothetical protein
MHQRWPAGNEHQAKPDASVATLYDILIWVQPFLDPLSLSQLAATDSAHRLGSTFSNLWLYQPWAPFRRRRWGFGIPSSNRSATHDQPPITASSTLFGLSFYLGKESILPLLFLLGNNTTNCAFKP